MDGFAFVARHFLVDQQTGHHTDWLLPVQENIPRGQRVFGANGNATKSRGGLKLSSCFAAVLAG
jgi:hypothetical protein